MIRFDTGRTIVFDNRKKKIPKSDSAAAAANRVFSVTRIETTLIRYLRSARSFAKTFFVLLFNRGTSPRSGTVDGSGASGATRIMFSNCYYSFAGGDRTSEKEPPIKTSSNVPVPISRHFNYHRDLVTRNLVRRLDTGLSSGGFPRTVAATSRTFGTTRVEKCSPVAFLPLSVVSPLEVRLAR